MENVKLSALNAWSYAWNQCDLDNASYIVKVSSALKAFVSGLLFGHVATKANVNKICYKYPESTLGKKQVKINDRGTKNHTLKQKNLNANEEELFATEKGITNTKERFLNYAETTFQNKGSLPRQRIKEYTPDQFIKLINAGNFSVNIRYVVKGSLYLMNYPDNKQLTLPESLVVNGKVYINNNNQLMLPKKFVVTDDLIISGCPSITDLSENHIIVGGNLSFEKCRNITYMPNVLRVAGRLVVKDCNNLNSEKIPNGIKICGG